MPAKGVFPTRENCDLQNPEEAFLWMFVGLPGVKGAPLLMPIEYYRKVSARLWDLGARPVEEPILEYVPPSGQEPNWLTSPGRWVKAGQAPEVDGVQKAKAVVERMTSQQRRELLEALTEDEQ